ncbi:MAG: tail fiber domain-containing protein, partial [Marinilabiliaceae bacterium]|nr:tail fiber domain-containing protein [Marinilabiliaceae bacterium]
MKKLLIAMVFIAMGWQVFCQIDLSSTNNVGIGVTANSTDKLKVEGKTFLNGNVGLGVAADGNHRLKVTGTTLFSDNVGIGTYDSNHKLNVVGKGYFSDNVGIGITASATDKLHVVGTTFLNGNVGLGTASNPAYRLNVSGNSLFSGNGYITGNVGIGVAPHGTHKLYVSGTSLFTGNTTFNSNVGIGITNPSIKLHVIGDASLIGNVVIGTSTPTNQLNVLGSSLFTHTFYGYTNYPLGIKSKVIDQNAGTILPYGEAIGIISEVQRCSSCALAGAGIGVYASSDRHLLNIGVLAEFFDVNANGVGIMGRANSLAGPIAGRYAGYFVGNVYVTGSINSNYLSPSDIIYKQDISEIENGESLDRLMLINPITYRFKQRYVESLEINEEQKEPYQVPFYDEDSDLFRKTHFGLIAQELKEIYPDLVYTNEEGYLSVNYVELIPILIDAVKELNVRVMELEKMPPAVKNNDENDTMPDVGKENKNSTLHFNLDDSANFEQMILYQNAPNPFDKNTTIRCFIPKGMGNVQLCVYNM